jgi:16S rRNA (adenine1518-N6/adenine1519-N6)-dimethyltransferase
MKYHPEIEQLLTSLHVSALKRYGQNFLIDDQVIQTILNAAKIKHKQKVMEIGPGLGAITKGLDLTSMQYTSYEIDVTFHRYLEKTYPQGKHRRLNFLKATSEDVHVIIGNLPYYMTTEILEKIYKDFSSFTRAILMGQKEVMPRLTAQPADDVYGPLAIFLATLGTITPILEVSPVSFFPEPHVQSILFQLDALPKGPLVEPKPFFYFIKKLFLHRRKTILNNVISLGMDRPEAEALLTKIKVSPQARPETISVQDYLSLFQLIYKKKTI